MYMHILYMYIYVYIYIYIIYIYVCVCVCMVYTVLMHFALLVIPIINGFTATRALQDKRVWDFLYIYT